MLKMILAYWEFLSRSLPPPRNTVGLASIPHFSRNTIIWSIFFTILNLLVPKVLASFYGKWYNQLPIRKKEELPPYIVSMLHHLTAVPFAWYLLAGDLQGQVEYNDTDPTFSFFQQIVIPFCIGNVVGDTFCFAIPQAMRGNLEFIIHHVLTVWMVVALVGGEANFARYFAHLLICDTTNVFFCTAWLLRLAGFRDHWIVQALEVLFAISFFFLRGINLVLVFIVIYFMPESSTLGLARYTLPPIAFLQWFWLSKIFKSIFAKTKPPKKDQDNKLQ